MSKQKTDNKVEQFFKDFYPITRARKAKSYPLGMPRGSVRALITMTTIVGYSVAVAYAMIADKQVPESLSTIVVTIIAFYFGTRSATKEVDGPEIEVSGDFSGEIDEISGNKNMTK